MLPVNLLNALKEYVLAQRTPLPVAATDATPKPGQQFELGQKLQGSVQAQVAPNVFKVNVSGQLVQMLLPPSIRSGDTVALQVIALQPRLTFSMVNSGNPLSTPEQLGATARLLSSLSQQAPEKASVRAAQSAPLWEAPHPPESKQLAGQLREALSNSGLFYESHQAQWLEGARSTAQLMHEPQNLTPEQARAVTAGNPSRPAVAGALPEQVVAQADVKAAAASNAANHATMVGETPEKTAASDAGGKATVVNDTYNKAAAIGDADSKAVMANERVHTRETIGSTADAHTSSQTSASALPDARTPSIPEHLQPLVQQQLNALETRQMVWQGNVWPGQDMQWEVHEQTPRTPAEEAQRQWVTQIQMDLPNLGAVAATLRLNSAGLSLTLNAATPQTRAALGNASTQLVSALADAGIPVLSTQVKQ